MFKIYSIFLSFLILLSATIAHAHEAAGPHSHQNEYGLLLIVGGLVAVFLMARKIKRLK